jgi:hypothetical protein
LLPSHPGPHLLAPFHQPSVKVQQFHAGATAPYLFIAAAPNLFPAAAPRSPRHQPQPLISRAPPQPVISPVPPHWSKQRRELPCFVAAAPLISPTLPPTIVFPIQSVMSSRAPSRSRRSAINTALGAIIT